MTNYELLININERTKENIENLKSSGRMEAISRCIAFSNDFDTLVSCCGSFSEYGLVREAETECINSICLCAQGFYKEAISSLRQCLEHTLFAVMLSTNDYEYRLWQAGKRDMAWGTLMDKQNGVFGIDFMHAYADDVDDMKSMELITVAKDVYRECSEFVHGNYEKINILSDKLVYNEEAFNRYINCFESIKYVICMSLFIRFREKLNNSETLNELESVIMDNIGMLTEVQLLYNKEGDHRDE